MNITQMLKRIRRSAGIEDSAVDWTDNIIIEELNDVQMSLFGRAIIAANQGHWQLTEYTPLIAGQRSYRMPSRAVMGTVILQQVSSRDKVDWYPLTELDENNAARYETSPFYSAQPAFDAVQMRKIVRGENWYLLPPAEQSGTHMVRTHYMARPSRITPLQPGGAGTNSGLIFSITGRTVGLTNSFVGVAEDGSITTQGSGTRTIDIIRPGGWHKVQWTGTVTFTNSFLFTIPTTGFAEADDLSMIQAGDVVRFEDQTDWPSIPAEFHRALADATAVKILTARDLKDAAEDLATKHVAPDLARFGDLLRPRDNASATVFVAPEFC